MADLVHLVRLAQDGDRPAFGELYTAFARMVHGILLSRVPRADVEDLVQDVFTTALQRLRTLRDPEKFGGWLSAIARNRATDHARHAPPVEQLADEAWLDGSAPRIAVVGSHERDGRSAANVVDATDRLEALAVLAAIRTLPHAYRETLVLRLVEGMTGPEIAERTGLTPASVRVNLHRGMKQLRERLKATYE